MELVKDEFNEESMEYLLVKLYAEVPLRDDFANLYIVSSEDNAVAAGKKNFIIVPTKGRAHLKMSEYNKTQNEERFDNPDEILSDELTKLIRRYIAKHKSAQIDKGTLFGKAALSPVVGNINKKLNISQPVNQKQENVNYIRHSIVSTVHERNNFDEMNTLAQKMKHKFTTAQLYVHKLIPDEEHVPTENETSEPAVVVAKPVVKSVTKKKSK
jgi:hypothetical protein